MTRAQIKELADELRCDQRTAFAWLVWDTLTAAQQLGIAKEGPQAVDGSTRQQAVLFHFDPDEMAVYLAEIANELATGVI